MTNELINEQLIQLQKEINADVYKIAEEVEKTYPGYVSGLGTVLGASIGGVISYAALSSAGVTGLSAAGVTSGLAALGGSMVAGIGMLSLPVAAVGGIGYFAVKHVNKNKKEKFITEQIAKLLDLKIKALEASKDFFREEISKIEILTLTFKKTLGK